MSRRSRFSLFHSSRSVHFVEARSRPGRTLPWAPLLVALSAASALLAGCPVYSAGSCAEDPNCNPPAPVNDYEAGPVPTPPVPGSCSPGCGDGYVCATIGTGFGCTPYDCRATEKSCPTGVACQQNASGAYVCAVATPDDCAKLGCIAGLVCLPGPIGARTCGSADPNACVADADCPALTGPGSLCLGGICKGPQDLCSDSTQCGTGTCVDGRCVSSCSASNPCPQGYSCDLSKSLCTGQVLCSTPPSAASEPGAQEAGSGADVGDAHSDASSVDAGGADASPADAAPRSEVSGEAGAAAGCSDANTCVDNRCVNKCSIRGECAAGLVCVGGGCVQDERATFFCDQTGGADGTQSVCAQGSICLHHNCYIGCAGASAPSCLMADRFPICKPVRSGAGPKFVCGSATNLGTDCDPTVTPPKLCAAGKVCIDGFCK